MNKSRSLSAIGSSRRQFLKTSGAAAIGGALASPLVFTRKASAALSPDDTLKVGLIGCGGRGSGAAAQALSTGEGVVLTAMGDVFDDRLQSSRKSLASDEQFGPRVRVSDDACFVGLDAYQKVLDSGVDVVLLAAPPGFRPQHLRAAVEAGKHIFCEKPMATDAPGVRSVLESAAQAKEKNLALVAGFCWRYHLGRRAFYQRIHNGAIGSIRTIYATYLTGPVKPMPPASSRPAGMGDVEWQLRNWYNFVWLSGDGLVEQACHSVDKIAWAMNGILPLKAVATGGRQFPNNEGNIFDHIDVFYEFPDGVRAFMAQRQISNCYGDNSDYLMGTEGLGTIKGWMDPVITGKESWRYGDPRADMYQVEHNELFESIRSGKPINDGVWMAHSTLMALMGRMAAYTGKEVSWDEAMNSQEKLVPDDLTWDMELPIKPMAMPGQTQFL
ncbi:MAG: Gfo/Idh/MocA family oxidoreductase [Sedimentisphaerales bacterium]|nr:Gfo/Idh/MocA family oxidoreductase [Sedimentisphaerales bacterium]